MTETAMNIALNSRIRTGDFEGSTVREYFQMLLVSVWSGGFNGQRSFPISGWEYDVIYPLIECGYIFGEVFRNNSGDIEDSNFDVKLANEKITELIKFMCKG